MRHYVFVCGFMAATFAGPAFAGIEYACRISTNTQTTNDSYDMVIDVENSGRATAGDAWSYDKVRHPDQVQADIKSNSTTQMIVTWFVPDQRFGNSYVTDGSYRAVINKTDGTFDLTISFSGDVYGQHHVGKCEIDKYKE